TSYKQYAKGAGKCVPEPGEEPVYLISEFGAIKYRSGIAGFQRNRCSKNKNYESTTASKYFHSICRYLCTETGKCSIYKSLEKIIRRSFNFYKAVHTLGMWAAFSLQETGDNKARF